MTQDNLPAAPAARGWRQLVTRQRPAGRRLVVLGIPGVGKTTLAASAPGGLIVDYERGLRNHPDARSISAPTWPQLREILAGLATDHEGVGLLAIDSVSGLEQAITTDLCVSNRKKSLADFGYGTGYDALAIEMRGALALLDRLTDAGLDVLLIGHSAVRTHHDPTAGEYDVWTSTLHKKVWPLVAQWGELVALARLESIVSDDVLKLTGRRVLRCAPIGSADGLKNRFNLPAELPLDEKSGWNHLDQSIRAYSDPAAYRRDLEARAAGNERAMKAIAKATSAEDLAAIGIKLLETS